MKLLKIYVSDEDYAIVIAHFNKPEDERMGSPLVAVRGDARDSLQRAIDREQAALSK